VTDAEAVIESELRRRIAEVFPGHNVIGEELGLSGAHGGSPTPGAPIWTVDPIDGTSNYISGIPIWAVLIALRVDGASVLGVAHAPALGETYEARRGGGATLNGCPITIDPVETLDEAAVLYGAAASFLESGRMSFLATLIAGAERDRGLGDFWGHMLVARGAAHAMVDVAPLSLWDVAALEPILAEAGAVASCPSGRPWAEGQPLMTSCDPGLHKVLVDLYLASELDPSRVHAQCSAPGPQPI
jgi:histidinol-phosphatase